MDLVVDKELVRSYSWTDFSDERSMASEEIINGRTYIKTGRYCSTAFVGEVYRLDSSSDEPIKYFMIVGMSRQHPNEYAASKSMGIEVAATNAFIEPIMKLDFMTFPEYETFKTIVEAYLDTVPVEYIRTKDERELAEDQFVIDTLNKISKIEDKKRKMMKD